MSCQKDELSNVSTGNNVRFTVAELDRWNTPSTAKSRSAEDGMAENAPVVTDVLSLRGENPADTLFLHAMVTDGIESGRLGGSEPQTRAAPVTSMDTYGSFGVLTSIYKGSWNEGACLPNYMYNVEVTKASGWTTTYRWPGAEYKIRFFAYAPYNGKEQGKGISLSTKETPGTPTIAYTVPGAVAEQNDLLVAVSGEIEMAGNNNGAASMNFKHVLTAVRFTTGKNMLPGRITKITLKGVYSSGTHAMGSDSWNIDNAKTADFSQSLQVQTDGSDNQEITSAAETFMMLPQTLPAGASIEVTYQDDLTWTSRTLTASIGNKEWPIGKTVTYRISTTSFVEDVEFEVTPIDGFSYLGGKNTYKVTSRAIISTGQGASATKNLPWKAEFVEDDGTGGYDVIGKPDWVVNFTTNGNGGTETPYTAEVKAQKGETANHHNIVLAEAVPVSNYDLSTKGGTAPMNTANCYVINAPGTYGLPLVYGNAIKNGKTNSSAYIANVPNNSSNNLLKDFVNHLNRRITDPYIYNNEFCTPQDAILVWQDEKELVTNVALSADGHSLTFEVPKASIKQGNAVVAVRDANGAIMWSWHIWVTDYEPGLAPSTDDFSPAETQRDKVVTNWEGRQYTFMGVNLGWCDDESTSYAARSVKVRFTLEGMRSKEIIITVNQTAFESSKLGNNPYFQWGRKDPMLAGIPSSSGGTENKSWHSDYFNFKMEFTPTTLMEGIQYPYIFYGSKAGGNNPSWLSITTFWNLWNANNTRTDANDDPVVKTVYDPSPVGYCVPATNAFSGFTYEGKSVIDDFSLINSPFTSSDDFIANKGYEFYCKPMTGIGAYDPTGGVIFFPASGYRRYNIEGAINCGGSTNYMQAGINDKGAGFSYAVYWDDRPLTRIGSSSGPAANGFPVRPVREE
ncbi:fibrobacter succinogene major domain protein [Alistipes onderdonkii subsp. vulgaris]|nr:fibrobacter succinogene major domain protein [Alistipes onderdonkii subsp. vulgaris]